MTKVIRLAKIEGRLAIRSIDGILFGIAMPLGVLLLTTMIAGNNQAGNASYTFLDSSFSALLVVGICATAFMGIPLTICDYRDKKILKHFFVTPASPVHLIAAQMVVAAITSIISAVLIIFVSIVFLDYHMQGNWGILIASYFLVMSAMYSLGLLIASLCKNIKIANLVCSAVYFPMLFLSGAVIPFELFPDGIQKVATFLPLTQGIKLLKSVSLGQSVGNPQFIVILLLCITILGFGLAAKFFRWE
ncbi:MULTISPECIES: ABC transporter permease [Enterococcus]|uniref:ABC transporter permease n=1 Tax=Enterococcus TaxID=1350 RepID=UPI0011071747|nr:MULTISPECIES: ABC transporter permease [Enterococcus]MDB1679599.1 ABC transporter permease [Enterococcus durans]